MAGAKAWWRVIGLIVLLVGVGPGAAFAQEQGVADSEADPAIPAEQDGALDGQDGAFDDQDVAEWEPAFTISQIEELVAPIALYPDALLVQVLIASTVPLDVVKADRWRLSNPDLAGEELQLALTDERWDESVKVLVGFPSILEEMATEIDWTSDLGDAFILQEQDTLDAVQRLRAQAQAYGNLESNEAQEVTVEEDAISIAPADPEVIYVPTYDPNLAYAPPPAQPVATTTAPATTTVVEEGYSGGEMVATGLIAFGAGIVVNEVFSDDDPEYYGPGGAVNWGGGSVYRPGRPGVNVGGDVNVNVDRSVDVERRDFAVDNDVRERRRREVQGTSRNRQTAVDRPAASRDVRQQRLESQLQQRGRDTRSASAPRASRKASGGGSADRDQLRARTQASLGAFESDGGLNQVRKERARGKGSVTRSRPTSIGERTVNAARSGERPAAQRATSRTKPTVKKERGSAFAERSGGRGAIDKAKSRGQKSLRGGRGRRG